MKNLSKLFTFLISASLIASCSKDDDNRNSNNGGGGSTSTGCSGGPSTVTDIDGNVYNVVSIGNQCWMKENLRTTKYRNGDPINTGLNDSLWEYSTFGAFSYPENSIQNDYPFGKHYNWYAIIDSRGLCPTGWHVPSDHEWNMLAKAIDVSSDTSAFGFNNYQSPTAGGSMKSVGDLQSGTGYWLAPNVGATNYSGFNAVSAANRDPGGYFEDMGGGTAFWSSTSETNNLVKIRVLTWDQAGLFSVGLEKNYGLSVRCIKD